MKVERGVDFGLGFGVAGVVGNTGVTEAWTLKRQGHQGQSKGSFVSIQNFVNCIPRSVRN